MKLHYKISSCSSENVNFPVSNLLMGNQRWQSDKFPQYPIAITLQFYEPATVERIKIISHSSKIPQKINILYHLPTEHNANQFTKLGYVIFRNTNTQQIQQQSSSKGKQQSNKQKHSESDSEDSPIKQQPTKIQNSSPAVRVLKEIKVINNMKLNCQFLRYFINQFITPLRLLIPSHHHSADNFYNQVSLSNIIIQGTNYLPNNKIPQIVMKNDSFIQINHFVKDKLLLLNQFKQKFIINEQFDDANQIKEIMEQITEMQEDVRNLNEEKIQLVREEMYNQAKAVKDEIQKIKARIEDIANNFYDPNKKTIRKFKGLSEKFQSRVKSLSGNQHNPNDNEFMKNDQREEGVIDRQNSQSSQNSEEQSQNDNMDSSRISYQERVVPALLNKLNNSRVNQNKKDQFDSIPEQNEEQNGASLPEEPEELSPSNEANSSVLNQFYDKVTIQKLHSKHWQFRMQALEQITKDCKSNSQAASVTKAKIKAFLFAAQKMLDSKQTNKKIISSALELVSGITQLKASTGEDRSDMTHDIEKVTLEVLSKIDSQNYSNKIKTQAEKVMARMFEGKGEIFGFGIVYHAIVKGYNDRMSSKLKTVYFDNLEYMVSMKGLDKGMPMSVVDFAVKKIKDPNNEVRKSVVKLLKAVKAQGGSERIKKCLHQIDLKESYMKQLGLID